MPEFVSRAGEKLDYALNQFQVSVSELVCADFGSSTGGFVDCLLQHNASKVYSVDTAYGELAWKLRIDSRVVVLERTNALFVKLPEFVDFISVDVGWTKQTLILPVVASNLKSAGTCISLIKPHYELSISKETYSDLELDTILASIKSLNLFEVKSLIKSPVKGKRGGNEEYLVFLRKL